MCKVDNAMTTPPFRRPLWPLRPATLLLALLCASSAWGQPAEDKRLMQARDMARQATEQAQQAQKDLAVARRERDSLLADKAKLEAELAEERRSSHNARAQLSEERGQRQGQIGDIQASLEAERSARSQQDAQLAALREQVSNAERALAEQRQLTQTVSSLLEQSVQALERAETSNRELHSLGLQAVQAWREAAAGSGLGREPFLQLTQVRVNSQAEQLRRQMDHRQLTAPAPAPVAANPTPSGRTP